MSAVQHRAPFQPIDGIARWRKVYSILEGMVVGESFDYAQLGELLGLDPEIDRDRIRPAVARASRELLSKHGRTLDAVPGVGYRVVSPSEHLSLAKRHQKKAVRQVRRGRDVVGQMDMRGLTVTERRVAEVMVQSFTAQDDFMRRADVRSRSIASVSHSIFAGPAKQIG